jgi:hypothetical protein
MAGQFEFDEKKTADENIEAFLSHIESVNKAFALLLRNNLDKMLPVVRQSGLAMLMVRISSRVSLAKGGLPDWPWRLFRLQ